MSQTAALSQVLDTLLGVLYKMKRCIWPAGAKTLAPYSPGVLVGGKTLYISGQIGISSDGSLVPGGIAAETTQALENMRNVLKEAGFTFDNVVSCDVLLTDMSEFGAVNDVYKTFFEVDPPSRACYAVKDLPAGALVEIKAIAVALN